MNRKHNPLVALTALILLATILVLACTGCSNETAAAGAEETTPRFTWELCTSNVMSGRNYIITDNETGVQYLVVWTSKGCGLTMLQDGEG